MSKLKKIKDTPIGEITCGEYGKFCLWIFVISWLITGIYLAAMFWDDVSGFFKDILDETKFYIRKIGNIFTKKREAE